MDRDNLISVIIPVHNGQDYLEGCIETIEAQTYQELEIIVVNDGSTDNTAQVCERLREKYSDISVITLPDLGVAAARNKAIEQAKGAYVTFVDADDRLRPYMLERLYDMLQLTGSDVAGCRFRMWSSEEEWEAFLQEEGTQVEYWVYDSYHYLSENILQNNCRCWSKLYRRKAIGNVRFREELTIGEDLLFLVDLLPGIRKAVELAYAGYGYYQNPTGAMNRPFTPAYMNQITCWELAKEEIMKTDADLEAQVNAQIMTAIMLTVGKIAVLPADGRKDAEPYLDICGQKLAAIPTFKDSARYLPGGYGVKIWVFSRMPGLYVKLYHILHSH
jgi:glycosyltransferase involved in cell wall biosynthesis